MDSKMILGAVVVIVIIVGAGWYLTMGNNSASKTYPVGVALTDPPTVPQGTQQLVVAYSSVQVQTTGGSGNQSGWVNATGSGTVNLLAVTNVSQTIANVNVAANATIEAVKFNITSVKIIINGTTHNVSSNNQVNVVVNGGQKVNSTSAVLVDFSPTVSSTRSANATSNTTAYAMTSSAKAIVVTSNASVSINTNIGSTATVTGALGAKLGIG